MLSFQTESIHPCATKHFFFENGQTASFKRFFSLLSEQNAELQAVFRQTFMDFQFQTDSGAVFWECPPISQHSFEVIQFEFIIIDAPSLAARTVDIEPFWEKFESANDGVHVVSFLSLGRDARLVVPTPPQRAVPQYYAHLLPFLRYGDPEQVTSLWQRVGTEVIYTLSSLPAECPLWISTSGLGVSWLHVRLDSVPKYYNWVPYKDETLASINCLK